MQHEIDHVRSAGGGSYPHNQPYGDPYQSLCVIPPRKLYAAQSLVQSIDPNAFLTITQIKEVPFSPPELGTTTLFTFLMILPETSARILSGQTPRMSRSRAAA